MFCCCNNQACCDEKDVSQSEERPKLLSTDFHGNETIRPVLNLPQSISGSSTNPAKTRTIGFPAIPPPRGYELFGHPQPSQHKDTQISLKFGFKIRVKSKEVKIFAIYATNVTSVLRKKFVDTDHVTDHLEKVQIHFKILPYEIHGYSKKFKVIESSMGRMKFSNEHLHTMELSKFLSSRIRFRLYNVISINRKDLLGEYILTIPSLKLRTVKPTVAMFMM